MTKYELWENWSKIDRPDILVYTSTSKQDVKKIKKKLKILKNKHSKNISSFDIFQYFNYYILKRDN